MYITKFRNSKKHWDKECNTQTSRKLDHARPPTTNKINPPGPEKIHPLLKISLGGREGVRKLSKIKLLFSTIHTYGWDKYGRGIIIEIL